MPRAAWLQASPQPMSAASLSTPPAMASSSVPTIALIARPSASASSRQISDRRQVSRRRRSCSLWKLTVTTRAVAGAAAMGAAVASGAMASDAGGREDIIVSLLATCGGRSGKIHPAAHIPAKWAPVRRKEYAPNNESRARSDSVGTERALMTAWDVAMDGLIKGGGISLGRADADGTTRQEVATTIASSL